MPSFLVPYVAPNASSWGPPEEDDDNPNAPTSKFALLPYAHFGRSDRLGRAADFTGRYQGQRDSSRYKRDDNEEFQYKVDEVEQSSFQLVDTAKAGQGSSSKRFVTPAARRRQHTARLRQVNAKRHQTGTTFQHHSQKTRNAAGRGGGGRGGRSGGRGRGAGGRFGGRYVRLICNDSLFHHRYSPVLFNLTIKHTVLFNSVWIVKLPSLFSQIGFR